MFLQLVRNLTPGQAPDLRIGGDTSDWTWWPVPGVPKPNGVRYSLTKNWVQVTAALSKTLGARMILGINLELDSATDASAEAQALVDGIGRSSIEGLELGNEPELYGSFTFYDLPDGTKVTGRPKSYDFPAYVKDFTRISESLPKDVPLVGPATGAKHWIPELPNFLAARAAGASGDAPQVPAPDVLHRPVVAAVPHGRAFPLAGGLGGASERDRPVRRQPHTRGTSRCGSTR